MKVYQLLGEARNRIHAMPLKKTGINKFSGYSYFELSDFLPATLKTFQELGLFGYVSFTETIATLTIVALEDKSSIKITSPMGSAALKGCHEVQNVGAVETYQRRYLWSTALEILENDILDSSSQSISNQAPQQTAPKPQQPVQHKPQTAPKPQQPTKPEQEKGLPLTDAQVKEMCGYMETEMMAKSIEGLRDVFKQGWDRASNKSQKDTLKEVYERCKEELAKQGIVYEAV